MKNLIYFKLLLLGYLFFAEDVYAFTKLRSGFENLSRNYLIPLLQAVGGTAIITYCILAKVKPDEYRGKITNVITLSIIGLCALEIMRLINESFN